MRVVFDTNIFVSAFVFPGGSADIAITRILEGEDALSVSPPIIHEVLGVLAEKFSRDREELSRVAVLLAEIGELVRPRLRVSVLADEPDNRILEGAVAGKADIIVSGDKALCALKTYSGIRIVTLRDYLGRR